MKRWYADPMPCPRCTAVLTPEFWDGFWRWPSHDDPRTAPAVDCDTFGDRIVAP